VHLRFENKVHIILNISTHTNCTTSLCELADLREEKDSPTATVLHTREIQKLKLELEQERNKLANIELKYQEEQKLNKSFQDELKLSKLEREK
ncbi:hypothetical protein S83_051667, partial [Arachis hypogaea]